MLASNRLIAAACSVAFVAWPSFARAQQAAELVVCKAYNPPNGFKMAGPFRGSKLEIEREWKSSSVAGQGGDDYCYVEESVQSAQGNIATMAAGGWKLVGWQPTVGRARAASSSKFGFGYCTMENERVYMKDMPVFVSTVFPRKANTQLYHNNVDNQWLSYVMSLPGFRGGTRGGCGSAPTEAAAKRALESAVGVPLRSHAWAYRKETFWTPGQ